MTEANYSNGDYYHYAYDAVGNVLQYTVSQGGSTITTTYNYNRANQLTTAQADDSPIIWHYVYDSNGRLTDVLPDGTSSSGAKRYTYTTAGFLIQVEAHDGNGYQLQAEMFYNGMGQRLSMTAYALGTSVTTNYTVDLTQSGRPLSATSGGNTTVYLYGLDPIAEFTTSWSYSLPDGTNTPRQLTNEAGEITLSGRYTPWGDSLEYTGTGNFTWGYFGGLMDTATGLLYVGNGQYYDPATGRFLTRQAQPGKTNPYVPWGDPSGALLSPLALAVLIYGRKRKKTKLDYLLIAMIVVLGAGVGLAACAPAPGVPVGTSQPPAVPPPPTPIPSPTSQPLFVGDWSQYPDVQRGAQEGLEWARTFLQSKASFLLDNTQILLDPTLAPGFYFVPPHRIDTSAVDETRDTARTRTIHEIGHMVDYYSGVELSGAPYYSSCNWVDEWQERTIEGLNFPAVIFTGDLGQISSDYMLSNPGDQYGGRFCPFSAYGGITVCKAEDFAETFTWMVYASRGYRLDVLDYTGDYNVPSLARQEYVNTAISLLP